MIKSTHFESIGRLACALKTPVSRISRVAEQIGVIPAIVLNGVPHYDEEGADRIAEHVAANRKSK